MTAEIITIGDEILIGQIVDTNSAWLGEKLGEHGFRVMRITSVSDGAEEISASVAEAMKRTKLVIVTGGLGPTKDDITKHTLAGLFNSKLTIHEPTLRFLEDYLGRRGVDLNQMNRDQAMMPDRCKVITNSNGTAPGMWFEQDDSVVISLPGVPYEMKSIMEEFGFSMIAEHFGIQNVVHKTVLTFGLPESMLAERIEAWENALPKSIKLAYLPNPSGVKLRLSCYDGKFSREDIDRRFVELQKIIGDVYLGEMPVSVESEVARMLCEKSKTLSIAESCTGGYLSSKFTALSGSSRYFLGGVVSYSNQVKIDTLGVSAETLERYGAVSEEVAREMAEGVRRITGSDYSIATTGIAGPTGATENKPVGLVYIAWATPEGVFVKRMVFGNLREQNIQRATAQAINLLRLDLL